MKHFHININRPIITTNLAMVMNWAYVQGVDKQIKEIDLKDRNKEQRLSELLKQSCQGTVLLYQLTELGNSFTEIFTNLEQLLANQTRVIITSNNYQVSFEPASIPLFMLKDLERQIFFKRLSKSRKRKSGCIRKSIYDGYTEEIKELLSRKCNYKTILQQLGIGSSKSLAMFIKSRSLKLDLNINQQKNQLCP